jgi:hypothetical protein
MKEETPVVIRIPKNLYCTRAHRLYGLSRRILIRSITPGEVSIVTVPLVCTRVIVNGPDARGSNLSG